VIPIALPLRSGGNTDETIAICVAYNMAALIPCRNLAVTSNSPFTDAAASIDVTMTLAVPATKMRLRPYISANRPNTSTNIALAIKNAIGIQLSMTALTFNSTAIDANATFVADNINGVVKQFSNTIINADFCKGVRFSPVVIPGQAYFLLSWCYDI